MGVKLGLGAGLTLAAAAVAVLPTACSTREPRVSFPAIGKTFTVMPAAMNHAGALQLADPRGAGTKAVHLTLMWGGRPIDAENGDPTLNFYRGHGDGRTLALSVKWAELAQAHKTSGCERSQIETLDGPGRGVALICDGRLTMGEYTFIEAVDSKGETRAATSWSTYRFSDVEDVLGVSVQLF